MAARRLVDYVVRVEADADQPLLLAESDPQAAQRQIAQRIPEQDRQDFPLPPGLAYFCVPEGTATASQEPHFFSFSLTSGDGLRAYGFALQCVDDWSPLLQNQQESVEPAKRSSSRRRVVFCLLSHHPFVSLFKEIVSWIYRSYRQQPEDPMGLGVQHQMDLALNQLVQNSLCPRVGSLLQVRVRGSELFQYHVHRGKVAHVDDYCFQVLFQCLSLKNVVYILNCMLLEQRLLLHSKHLGLLTPVGEALCALLFPFTWPHVYIPLLPIQLIEYLHAPVPYLIGLHTSSLATRVGADVFASCVVVHLDKDKVVTPIISRVDDSPIDFRLPRLPSKDMDALLQSVADIVPRPVITSVPSAAPREPPMLTLHDETVEVTFAESKLGITFESTHDLVLRQGGGNYSKHAPAIVKALPRQDNGLPGPAEQSNAIFPGSLLVGINGESCIKWTFQAVVDRIRLGDRPLRLAVRHTQPRAYGAAYAEQKLLEISMVPIEQVHTCNELLPWVNDVRSGFAFALTSILQGFSKFIRVAEHVDTHGRRTSSATMSVTFDSDALCKTAPEMSRQFLEELTKTQLFLGFVNDTVMAGLSHADAYPHVHLFKQCIYLLQQTQDPRPVIALLFERDLTPVETIFLDLLDAAEDEYVAPTKSPSSPISDGSQFEAHNQDQVSDIKPIVIKTHVVKESKLPRETKSLEPQDESPVGPSLSLF